MQSGECSFAKHKLLSKREEKEKNYFHLRVLWSFIRLERCFPNFWLIFLLLNGKSYTLDAIYSEIIVVKKCKFGI